MIVVRLEVGARAAAVGETLLTSARAGSGVAHLCAFASARAAVDRIRLRVDARVSAFRRPAAAVERAAAVHTDLALVAFLATAAAILEVALGVDAGVFANAQGAARRDG